MLYELKTKIRYSKVGIKFVDFISTKSIFFYLYKILDLCRLTDNSKNKNFINKKSLSFFEKNRENINNIISVLADEKSKITYQKNISYRCDCHLKNHPPFSLKDQYFPKNIIKLSDNEVFVDCGAFDGDTIQKFIKESKGKYKQIISFETNRINFKNLQNRKINNSIFFNLGVWNKKDTLCFYEDNVSGGSSKLEQTKVEYTQIYTNNIAEKNINKYTVEVDSIDNIPECSDMTFLKMDIEGAELNALKGAEKTIRKNKPKLAICIYHSDEDMINIPKWIMNLNMNYKIYIRHHSFLSPAEIVCYAI